MLFPAFREAWLPKKPLGASALTVLQSWKLKGSVLSEGLPQNTTLDTSAGKHGPPPTYRNRQSGVTCREETENKNLSPSAIPANYLPSWLPSPERVAALALLADSPHICFIALNRVLFIFARFETIPQPGHSGMTKKKRRATSTPSPLIGAHPPRGFPFWRCLFQESRAGWNPSRHAEEAELPVLGGCGAL